MADLRINPTWDPFNSDATTAGEYKRIQTAGYSGAYLDYTAPAAANFPLNTPARYFIYPRFTPYTGDYTTYPMLVKDVTTATTLTRVSGAPSTNQYRVAPPTSKSPAIIELHSGQAGHTIALDYYAISSIVSKDDWNTIDVATSVTAPAITGTNITGTNSVNIGTGNTASAARTLVNGDSSTASAVSAHAEGSTTTASGAQSHSEGAGTIASGINSHAEGTGSQATGNGAHAEGYYTIASADYSKSLGLESSATRQGQIAYSVGMLTVQGDCQRSLFAFDAFTLASSGSTTKTITGTANRSYMITVMSISHNTATGGTEATYDIFTARRIGATMSIIGTATNVRKTGTAINLSYNASGGDIVITIANAGAITYAVNISLDWVEMGV